MQTAVYLQRALGWAAAVLVFGTVLAKGQVSVLSPAEAQARQASAQAFHVRASQKCGVLVPLYLYPENIHTNAVYNKLIDIKRSYESVPIWVIVNPDSGPGQQVDANYTKAIDRLQGAGCMVLGYVSTRYGQRTPGEVTADLDAWLALYPRVQGIFFDEMIYEDTDTALVLQLENNRQARARGFWPTVANPGAETPERYFSHDAADVILVHEGDRWPEETRLKGDYFGGYSDYPPHMRGVLVYNQPRLNAEMVSMVRKYARMIYVTDDVFHPNEPAENNPWDSLSSYLDCLCRQLAR